MGFGAQAVLHTVLCGGNIDIAGCAQLGGFFGNDMAAGYADILLCMDADGFTADVRRHSGVVLVPGVGAGLRAR